MRTIETNEDIPTSISRQGQQFLARLAATVGDGGMIIDIGPMFGASTWILAKNAPGATVNSVDTWVVSDRSSAVAAKAPQAPLLSRSAFNHYTADCANVVAHHGWSPGALGAWTTPIDLAFIDGVLSNPALKTNLAFFSERLKPGGILAGDSFTSGAPQIIAEVHALADAWGVRPEVSGRVWAIRKPGADGSPQTVYAAAGPYGPHDLNISVRLADSADLLAATGAWAGRLHQRAPVTAVKLDWPERRPDELSGAYQVMDARKTLSNWTPFGTFATTGEPIVGFRGHLVGPGSNALKLTYQDCKIVTIGGKPATRNTRTFQHSQWTRLDDAKIACQGVSALFCAVAAGPEA